MVNSEAVLKRWKEYFEKLMNKKNNRDPRTEEPEVTLLVQTLLVFEFVVSPTHDYTTFSEYGSDVCINYLFFAFLFLLTSHRFVQRYGDHNVLRLVAASLFTIFTSIVHVITYFVLSLLYYSQFLFLHAL